MNNIPGRLDGIVILSIVSLCKSFSPFLSAFIPDNSSNSAIDPIHTVSKPSSEIHRGIGVPQYLMSKTEKVLSTGFVYCQLHQILKPPNIYIIIITYLLLLMFQSLASFSQLAKRPSLIVSGTQYVSSFRASSVSLICSTLINHDGTARYKRGVSL